MPKQEILPQLNSRFEDSVARLSDEGRALSKAYVDFTKHMLEFASRFYELWERARKLDEDVEYGAHREYLVEQLSDAIGTDNKSIRSRWILIGQYASDLSPLKSSLPPARDSLYEVALAIDSNKPVNSWVEKGALTSNSSVREIRALRKPKGRSSKQSSRNIKKRHLNAQVTLCFSTYDDAVEILLKLIKGDENFEISSHKAFGEALQAKVGEKAYEEISYRIR